MSNQYREINLDNVRLLMDVLGKEEISLDEMISQKTEVVKMEKIFEKDTLQVRYRFTWGDNMTFRRRDLSSEELHDLYRHLRTLVRQEVLESLVDERMILKDSVITVTEVKKNL